MGIILFHFTFDIDCTSSRLAYTVKHIVVDLLLWGEMYMSLLIDFIIMIMILFHGTATYTRYSYIYAAEIPENKNFYVHN